MFTARTRIELNLYLSWKTTYSWKMQIMQGLLFSFLEEKLYHNEITHLKHLTQLIVFRTKDSQEIMFT
jgi:hypothetical protein